jgi:hypothetical protein
VEGRETLLLFALAFITPNDEVRGGWGEEGVLRERRGPLERLSVVIRDETDEASLSEELGRSVWD